MMKRMVVAVALAACCCAGVRAQTGATAKIASGTIVDPAKSFDLNLSALEQELVPLVKAMPAEKFDFAPSAAIFVAGQGTEYTGVSTFREMVLHIAAANYSYAGRVGGMKPDVDLKALSLSKDPDKEKAVAALEASFAFAHKAFGTLTAQNAFESVQGMNTRASVAGGLIAHAFDHYGQLVEYLRMNGIVPPASRK